MPDKNSQKDIGFILAKLESMHESINDIKRNMTCFEDEVKELTKVTNDNKQKIGNIYVYIGIISTLASALVGFIFKISGTFFDQFIKKL